MKSHQHDFILSDEDVRQKYRVKGKGQVFGDVSRALAVTQIMEVIKVH